MQSLIIQSNTTILEETALSLVTARITQNESSLRNSISFNSSQTNQQRLNRHVIVFEIAVVEWKMNEEHKSSKKNSSKKKTTVKEEPKQKKDTIHTLDDLEMKYNNQGNNSSTHMST